MELSAAPLDPPHGKHNLLADELAFGLTVIHATPPTGWFMGSHRAVGSAGYVASSSRSQVQAWTASAAAILAWGRPSVDVRWRPPPSVAIVTHFVTRPPASRSRATAVLPHAFQVCGRAFTVGQRGL